MRLKNEKKEKRKIPIVPNGQAKIYRGLPNLKKDSLQRQYVLNLTSKFAINLADLKKNKTWTETNKETLSLVEG